MGVTHELFLCLVALKDNYNEQGSFPQEKMFNCIRLPAHQALLLVLNYNGTG